ncbi:MAG: ABC transporter permease subunit, partial [Trebonia sp.]
MTWLTWRQFRTQAVIAFAALAAYAVLLAATGPHLASMYAADGLGSCHGGSCTSAADYFTGSLVTTPYSVLYLLSSGIILLVPVVIGLFWGAPLIARELETGTAALAWNQSVTRTRWLAAKLTAGGLAAMAVTEALSLMQTWWEAPISQAVAEGASAGGLAQSRFTQLNFATHGITPLGYAAFAFALGVAAGALIRRTVPAMAVTLAVFAALQVAMPLWVRPNLAPPDHTVLPITSVAALASPGPGGTTYTFIARGIPDQSGAWLLSSGPVNAAGRADSTTPAACVSLANASASTATGTASGLGTQVGHSAKGQPGNPVDFLDCLASHGVREAVSYQPAGRYWRFQATETAIYLALALAMAGYCFRRLSRR